MLQCGFDDSERSGLFVRGYVQLLLYSQGAVTAGRSTYLIWQLFFPLPDALPDATPKGFVSSPRIILGMYHLHLSIAPAWCNPRLYEKTKCFNPDVKFSLPIRAQLVEMGSGRLTNREKRKRNGAPTNTICPWWLMFAFLFHITGIYHSFLSYFELLLHTQSVPVLCCLPDHIIAYFVITVSCIILIYSPHRCR